MQVIAREGQERAEVLEEVIQQECWVEQLFQHLEDRERKGKTYEITNVKKVCVVGG